MDRSSDDLDPHGEPAGDGADPRGNSDALGSRGPGRREKMIAAGGEARDLRRSTDSFSDLEPFFERADAGAGRGFRPGFDFVMSHGSHAALAFCVMGFAWAAGSHFLGSPPQDEAPKAAMQEAARREASETAELRRATQKMSEDMRALKSNFESLRASIAQGQNSKDQHALEKSLDGLKTRLDAVKSETSSAIGELSAKVDHLQREPATKLQQVVDRLDRIERQTAAPPAPSAPPPVAAGQGKTAGFARAQNPIGSARFDGSGEAPPKRPQLITSWVVRAVYDGVALVENATGSLEVAPGETIPGAGTVKSIERRGGGWIVITSRGLVDSAHDVYLP
ncbi:hypothetical protein [Methylocapsa acidiphila]|uniref:hypothetical protein n=1 Tax=Methylocapsa acidiphila TaxID=133552 RepID=UPI00041C0E4B|nr:hypothetical protein [Methylocapsa acidiphila]